MEESLQVWNIVSELLQISGIWWEKFLFVFACRFIWRSLRCFSLLHNAKQN